MVAITQFLVAGLMTISAVHALPQPQAAQPSATSTPAPAPVAVEPSLEVRRPRPAATKVSEITGEGAEKPLVILADSDANIQKTLTKHLEDGGYAVQTVATCADILTRARTTQPAALAVD
ncbi:MAG: hypothetical protein EOO38_26655, partial [Cytophagaceae bacterium]